MRYLKKFLEEIEQQIIDNQDLDIVLNGKRVESLFFSNEIGESLLEVEVDVVIYSNGEKNELGLIYLGSISYFENEEEFQLSLQEIKSIEKGITKFLNNRF